MEQAGREGGHRMRQGVLCEFESICDTMGIFKDFITVSSQAKPYDYQEDIQSNKTSSECLPIAALFLNCVIGITFRVIL